MRSLKKKGGEGGGGGGGGGGAEGGGGRDYLSEFQPSEQFLQVLVFLFICIGLRTTINVSKEESSCRII